MKRFFVVIALLIGIIGCSSMPSGPQFSGVQTTAASNESVLYVYRPDAYYGKALAYPVLLNGKRIADLGNQGYFILTIKPGEYNIQPDTDSIDHEFTFNAAPGEVLFLRLKVNRKPAICFCTSIEFEKVDQSSAVNELAATRQETDRVYGY